MISLKTLPQATAKEVFNQVKTHLLTQNVKSKRFVGDLDILGNPVSDCAYRGENGLKCAAGCLIADDEYDERLDTGVELGNTTWTNLADKGSVPKEHKDLIRELQKVHDLYEPYQWVDKLNEIAVKYGF